MSSINDALEEAEYFYREMEKTSKIPKAFRHNLNAFVSRARAVTWVMKKHFSGNQKFREWYATQEKMMNADELMRFFVEAGT